MAFATIDTTQLQGEVKERNNLYKKNQELISNCKSVLSDLQKISSYSGIKDLEKTICKLQQIIKDSEI